MDAHVIAEAKGSREYSREHHAQREEVAEIYSLSHNSAEQWIFIRI
jgi:hypothetical protein